RRRAGGAVDARRHHADPVLGAGQFDRTHEGRSAARARCRGEQALGGAARYSHAGGAGHHRPECGDDAGNRGAGRYAEADRRASAEGDRPHRQTAGDFREDGSARLRSGRRLVGRLRGLCEIRAGALEEGDRRGEDQEDLNKRTRRRSSGRESAMNGLRVVWLAALMALLLPAGHASAETGQSMSVRMVGGFAAGGRTDVIARIVAQKLSESLGQQFYVENIGGAGGNVGNGIVARAPADGYTIAVVSTGFIVNPSLY